MLSRREEEVLKSLLVLGFKFVARDKSNALLAYTDNDLGKDKSNWYCEKYETNYVSIENSFSLLSSVKFEDEEPTSINVLLNCIVKPNPTKDDVLCAKAFLMNGFSYIARHSNGELYLYNEYPEKSNVCWITSAYGGYVVPLNRDMFLFVDWDDNKPFDLHNLIEGDN